MAAESTRPATLAALSGWAAVRYGEATFLEAWSGRRGVVGSLSFAAFHALELAARAALSDALRMHQLAPRGGRVAIMCHACADSLALSLAVPSLGRTLVCLNWRQPPAVLAELLHGLGCDVLLAGRSFAKLAREIVAMGASACPLLLLIDGSEAELPPPLCRSEAALSFSPVNPSSYGGFGNGGGTCGGGGEDGVVGPSDTALVMFTSGDCIHIDLTYLSK